MAQVEYADRAGFDVVSLVDHHFFEQFSISANPLAFFAAAAQRTRRIRSRTALHPLPLESVKERLGPSGYGFYGSEALPMLCKLSARDLVAQGVAFVGTPEQVLGQLRELVAAYSMAELSIGASFGGLEQWKVLRTMELFATRVLPSLRPPKSLDVAR